MDSMEWDPEYFGEDYPEWDPEFLPGIPSPGAALARRFVPSRRRPTPSRMAPRPMGTPASPGAPTSAVLDRLRMLDERQKARATQLANLQQRTAAQQSSETFGPLATGAAGAFALGIKSGDAFAPFVTHGLPVAQLLLASRGRAISAGFRANPWSTLGFPLAAVLLTVFRDKIPGLAPPIVEPPQLLSITPDGSGGFLVTIKRQEGAVLRFTKASGTGDPSEPSGADSVFPAVGRLGAGDRVKVRAFLNGVGSESILVSL
jgi:hypothetical protein